mmetsp:Transcript_19047/g.32401  ORF Transcript_19047/g.32401 Transcript_19047/m.32401 type:complete len:330 (-) Transcript_19047:196-1185(-)|eukprot:CAMPEP_0206166242 /NCGR_PEP_ID=MMETSP1474-20131121/23455_1 /ASSEMBLY_ACC=CAM_ASM_001110 /TAXON_ID=97495 /ORGANISM="Imantonia sp., Strain RCC918" /LENGTH=329 /DNA_ID=CAMNT_0053570145 /DNA_START=90 /DNA_END=1079 /DNA_ORIENTATION=+
MGVAHWIGGVGSWLNESAWADGEPAYASQAVLDGQGSLVTLEAAAWTPGVVTVGSSASLRVEGSGRLCLGALCAPAPSSPPSPPLLLPPRSSPPPLLLLPPSSPPPTTKTMFVATITFIAAGLVADVREEHKADVATAIATLLGISISSVVVRVQAASVEFVVDIEYTQRASADAAVSSLDASLNSTAEANDFFSSAGIDVTSAPTFQVREVAASLVSDDASTSELPLAVIAAAVGGLAALGLAAYAVYRLRSKAKMASTPVCKGAFEESFSTVAGNGSTSGTGSRSSSSLPCRSKPASSQVTPTRDSRNAWIDEIDLPAATDCHQHKK